MPTPGIKPEYGSLQQRRRREELLRLILAPGPQPPRDLTALAAEAEWPLPATVSLVIARPPRGADGTAVNGTSVSEPAVSCTVLGREVLCGQAGPDTRLLIPDVITRPEGLALADALPGRLLSVGPAVPLPAAADSLRWARRALSLAENGTIDADHLIWCEDHLVTLWLLSDPRLADHVIRQQLSLLSDLTPRQRARILDTLGPWLERRGTAAEIAALLNVHPQTVRYRIRKIERAFGARLHDPDARFTLELVLRVLRLRQRQKPPQAPQQRQAQE